MEGGNDFGNCLLGPRAKEGSQLFAAFVAAGRWAVLRGVRVRVVPLGDAVVLEEADGSLARLGIRRTTNNALVGRGNVLHDPDLAEAIVDRILERGLLVQLDGPSVRARHLVVDPLGQPALREDTISGNHRPDFMEPATDGARMGVAIVDNQPGCAIRFCQQGYGKYAIDNVMINRLEL